MTSAPPRERSRARLTAVMVLFAGSMIYWTGCAPRFVLAPFPEGPVVVRVAVSQNEGALLQGADGAPLRISAPGEEGEIEVGQMRVFSAPRNRVRVTGDTNGEAVAWSGVSRVMVASRGWILLDGAPYPGRMEVVADGHVRVINVVGLENYLRGVVPHEIGFLERSTLEAVKAQAVVSRTYALRTMEKKGGLEATIMDQVYRGAQGRNRWSDRAIEETRGAVVTVDGYPALTVFHSSCAGRTEAIGDIWKGRGNHGHLKGVKDVDRRGRALCEGSKYHEWADTWTAEELEEVLREQLPRELEGLELPEGSPGNVKLRVRKRSRGGRVVDAEVRAWGQEFRLRGERIRWVFRRTGGGILRSGLIDRFEMLEDGGLRIEGRGWGHGLGMCQVGALERARRGAGWREILEHFYDGIEIERMSGNG